MQIREQSVSVVEPRCRWPSLVVARLRRSALLTPYPQYTGVTQARAAYGDSIYHAFMLRLERRVARGLTLQANYTVSKTIDAKA